MIQLVLLLLTSPLLVATTALAVELVAGAFPYRKTRRSATMGHGSVAILIPAHNEELCIRSTLKQVQAEAPGVRIIVVADNCTDATAAIARSAQAEVAERLDDAHRGKGFALAFGREQLSAAPPDCVIVLDADTIPASGALQLLAERSLRLGRPAQSAYFIEPAAQSTPLVRFSAIAFYAKNVVRQLGLHRIGAPAILTGSGMAFPWSIFVRLPLETAHVAEDLVFGIHSSLAGAAPVFVPDAIVISQASSDAGTGTQRRRWESGFFDAAGQHLPALLLRALRRADPRLLWLALHLATPPLLLLFALDWVGLIALSALAVITGTISVALSALGCVTAAAAIGLLTSMTLHGKRVPLRDLMAIPSYIAWKVGVSLRALVCRERTWIRTNRK
jgi:cellulose synthase/poly-beta-1,6-N-acetylglucosamine synthase-like glycosyltransferase